MNYSFHPEAEEEFLNAIDYYEEHKFGLGSEFAIEVHSTIENIISFPTAWPLLEYDIRRCLTQRFPYGIIYSIEKDLIFILAVMHLHREPEYWKSRIL
jgi:toxin ParE1/3/4